MKRVTINPQFEGARNDASGNKYIQFSIPEQWHNDVQLFIKRKYSRIIFKREEKGAFLN